MKLSVANNFEKDSLNKFRENVKDLGQDDETLLRFLRARKCDLGKAEEMLRKSIKWRRDNQVDSYHNWQPPTELKDDFKFDCLGEDAEGHAVMFIPLGRWCLREKLEKGYRTESRQYLFYMLETMHTFVRQSRTATFILVFDIMECSYWKLAHIETVQLILAAFREFEANYPETLKAAYVIRAPRSFNYIWGLVRQLLSGETFLKTQILGEDWEVVLRGVLPESVMSRLY